ncbi:hypothetical protein Tco_0589151 [Tanacetum coccineum]
MEIYLEGKKSQESNIGDSDNTRDGGKTASRAIITWGGRIASYACMFFIYRSSCKGEKTSISKRYLVKSSEDSRETFLGELGDDVERLWNELERLGTSMKVLEVKELCKLLGSEGGESLRCLDAKLTLEMGQKERNGVAGLIGHE